MAEELEIVCLIQPNWCYNWYYLSSKKAKNNNKKKEIKLQLLHQISDWLGFIVFSNEKHKYGNN